MDSYKTFLTENSVEFTEKRSLFISLAAPVKTQDEAAGILNSIRKQHRDANHNCYAYRLIDVNNNFAITQKYSDDGEPGGTAGMPIYNVIKTNELYNCIVIVTRYFGGIQLGAGGLVRAYSTAAAMAVNQAKLYTVQKLLILNIIVDYNMAEKLLRKLELAGFTARNITHLAQVSFDIPSIDSRAGELRTIITQTTNGTAVITNTGYVWT